MDHPVVVDSIASMIAVAGAATVDMVAVAAMMTAIVAPHVMMTVSVVHMDVATTTAPVV